MCGQTKIFPNGSIVKPKYSGISCFILAYNCTGNIDTPFVESTDCDGQEMGGCGASRTGRLYAKFEYSEYVQFGSDRYIYFDIYSISIMYKLCHRSLQTG